MAPAAGAWSTMPQSSCSTFSWLQPLTTHGLRAPSQSSALSGGLISSSPSSLQSACELLNSTEPMPDKSMHLFLFICVLSAYFTGLHYRTFRGQRASSFCLYSLTVLISKGLRMHPTYNPGRLHTFLQSTTNTCHEGTGSRSTVVLPVLPEVNLPQHPEHWPCKLFLQMLKTPLMTE